MVLARLIFSSSRRAWPEHLRLGQIELRLRGLVARVGVVEGLLREQLALEEAARALEVGLRQPEVGLALPDGRLRHVVGRFGLLDLLEHLAVFDLGERLAAAHLIAQLHADRLAAAPAPSGTASTVAAPIRLPTTSDVSLMSGA